MLAKITQGERYQHKIAAPARDPTPSLQLVYFIYIYFLTLIISRVTRMCVRMCIYQCTSTFLKTSVYVWSLFSFSSTTNLTHYRSNFKCFSAALANSNNNVTTRSQSPMAQLTSIKNDSTPQHAVGHDFTLC